MKYFLETNICIYVINKRSPSVIEKLIQFPPQELGREDLLIAAHALAADVTLVTNNNEAEFQRVPHLRVENWVT